MEILLTKEACLVLAVAYKIYKSRRDDGAERSSAAQFQFLRELNCKETKGLSSDDMQDALSELASQGLMKVYCLDFKLTDKGIALSEYQVKEKHKSVLLWIKSILETAGNLIALIAG